MFEELDDYKESQVYLEQCEEAIAYNDAVDTMQDEDYAEAAGMFEALGSYEDSQELMLLCQNYIDYQSAVSLYESGEYEQAMTAFIALADFEDSGQYAGNCQTRLDYAQAKALLDDGEYLEAKLIFETIKDFEDSEELLTICTLRLTFEEAMQMIQDSNYEDAYVLLNDISQTADKADIELRFVADVAQYHDAMRKCNNYRSYMKGKSYYEQSLFYSAYKEFLNAEGMFDAEELAQACIQPFETQEIYINPEYTENRVSVTFIADAVRNVCVKVYSGQDLVSIVMVKAGEKITIKLPDGPFSFNVAKGGQWFGQKEYFGNEGTYEKVFSTRICG